MPNRYLFVHTFYYFFFGGGVCRTFFIFFSFLSTSHFLSHFAQRAHTSSLDSLFHFPLFKTSQFYPFKLTFQFPTFDFVFLNHNDTFPYQRLSIFFVFPSLLFNDSLKVKPNYQKPSNLSTNLYEDFLMT